MLQRVPRAEIRRMAILTDKLRTLRQQAKLDTIEADEDYQGHRALNFTAMQQVFTKNPGPLSKFEVLFLLKFFQGEPLSAEEKILYDAVPEEEVRKRGTGSLVAV